MLRRTIEDLGLREVLNQIKGYCLSAEGASSILNAQLQTEMASYLETQGRIDSILALLSENASPSLESFPDIFESLELIQSKPYGSLDPCAIYDIGTWLRSARLLSEFLSIPSEDARLSLYPVSSLIGEIDDSLISLEKAISNVLESPGQVKKTYPTVARAIAEIEQRRIDRSRYSSQLVSANRELMQSDKPSFKDSRVVIPLKAELKSQMPGLVHSYSASNQTLFVEPFKLVEYNNNVVMAEQKLQIEIARLVNDLSQQVFSCEMALRELSRRISTADSLYSYAVWARASSCSKVLLSENGSVSILNCRHPLLRQNAVPITINIGSNVSAMVISGPNAGGKTVTIKTVGLMVLLNQICGFVPASDGTSLPLYDEIFTDIGDDQSIEANLSTFSGHMHQIGFILRSMSLSSLVILDELGSGTDEVEGSAIAKAVLQYCMEHCKTTLVSSHHNALKQFAYVSENVVNASMEFDEKTHKPTFRVIAGLPGESHALDTAIRMKLPRPVIQMAREFLGKDEVSVSSLIKGLEQRRLEADARLSEIAAKEKALSEQIRKNDLKALKLDQKEYFIKSGKLTEMDSFIADSRKMLENLVTELRTGEMDREKTRKVKKFISDLEEGEKRFESRLESQSESIESRAFEPSADVCFEVGMDVLCGTYKRLGTIVRREGKGKWQVAIGPMKFTFKESELLVAPRIEGKKVHVEYSVPSLRPKLVLDVRGKTLQEATEAVSDQIEACLVHGLSSFAIIHGYGDGILSHGIHQYLSKVRNVESFKFAVPEDGGQGKTYVVLG
ncbi:MAG: Smr/MutS family protein [Sphaerochaetaceae bacterium]|jgi:DNA mismatch repair protein MutS2|nr:Smr/MutS family protein [Sphaerochaetaceae bacterium]NLY06748.1 endonuclease MutS2 [Spirochaetales bacterium]